MTEFTPSGRYPVPRARPPSTQTINWHPKSYGDESLSSCWVYGPASRYIQPSCLAWSVRKQLVLQRSRHGYQIFSGLTRNRLEKLTSMRQNHP